VIVSSIVLHAGDRHQSLNASGHSDPGVNSVKVTIDGFDDEVKNWPSIRLRKRPHFRKLMAARKRRRREAARWSNLECR
jgi:hypothetical protein